MKVSPKSISGLVAFIVATVLLVASMIAASIPAIAASTDTQTSTANPKLTCTVSVTIQGGKAVVTWTITGASSASIDPLTFTGKVPLKGTQTVDYSGNIIVLLVAKDADGHSVRCHAGAGGTTDFVGGTTGNATPSASG